MKSKIEIFVNGIVKENPVLKLTLGMCPVLAVTTSATNGIGMGLTTTFVLLSSNVMISALRNVIPKEVRNPIFCILFAIFATIAELLLFAYFPALAESLGIFIPLIVVNCILLARAEIFARRNSVTKSMFDALGMGLGFTLALTIIGAIREILGSGAIFNYSFIDTDGIIIFILPSGAFIVIGFMIALVRSFQKNKT
jgi:electron transport complex protein RnfE